MMRYGREWSDRRLETVLGKVLRIGVTAAALVVVAGGGIYLWRHGGEPVSLGLFRGEPSDFSTLNGILRSVLNLRGRGLIQLGLLILIATPVARVAFAVAGFAWERDRFYAGVASLVLILLLASLAGWVG